MLMLKHGFSTVNLCVVDYRMFLWVLQVAITLTLVGLTPSPICML